MLQKNDELSSLTRKILSQTSSELFPSSPRFLPSTPQMISQHVSLFRPTKKLRPTVPCFVEILPWKRDLSISEHFPILDFLQNPDQAIFLTSWSPSYVL